MKKKYILIGVLLGLICIVILKKYNINKTNTSSSQELETFYKGIGIGVKPTYVDDNENIEFTVQYKFSGDKNKKFYLTIYWDYKQTKFLIDNKEYSLYSFEEESRDYTKKIDVRLDKKFTNNIHNLTVVISDKNDNLEKMPMRIQSNYKFVNNAGKKTEENYIYDKPYKIYKENSPELNIINNDFNDSCEIYIKGKYNNTDRIKKVRTGEEFEVALRMGNFIGNGDQLVITELDNKQVQVNNKDYLLYNLNEKHGIIYDRIKLIAPSEPGEYVLSSFMVPNPFSHEPYINRKNLFTYKVLVE